jgi:hypothetical protein
MYHQNETNRHFELNDLEKNAADALRVMSSEEARQVRRTNRGELERDFNRQGGQDGVFEMKNGQILRKT